MAAKRVRTAVKKKCCDETVKAVLTSAQALEEGQCDYSDQTTATNAYNDALRAEEIACTNVETAEAALIDAQGAYDAAAASYEDAKATTDSAKADLDATYESKRP